MKQTISIIGSGNLGTTLAIRLHNSPYRLLIFDQDLSKAQAVTKQLLTATPGADVEAIDCATNASWEADIIVLAIPESSINAVADRIREVATCKIVICLTNSQHNEDSGHFKSAAMYVGEELQQQLPNSKVVNVIIMGKKSSNAFLISTHQEALATVSTLAQDASMNPIAIENWSVSNKEIH